MAATRLVVGASVLALASSTGLAQQASDVAAFSISETGVLGDACFKAFGELCPHLTLAGVVDRIDRGDVKLVVVEIYYDLPPEDKEVLLPALERHIDRGGRLLLAYTNLDEWGELQELVGVVTIGEVSHVRGREIWSVDPPHPTWSRSVLNPITAEEKYWEDNGDFLVPDPGGYVLVTWDSPGSPAAITLTRNGRVLTCGLDYDAFDGDINSLVRNQLTWLLTCQADLDGDGELTFFDFLAFQNLFAAGDLGADFAFDGVLDFFDFIEFQEQFVLGCP